MGEKYRIIPHGSFGKWYKIERKFLFIWLTIREFYETREEAQKDVELMKEIL